MIHTKYLPRNCVVFLLLCKLTRSAIYGSQQIDSHKINGRPCLSTRLEENRAISRHVCVDHCNLLLQHLSIHMHFVTNGYKRFSKTKSTNPRQRVPLISHTAYIISSLLISAHCIRGYTRRLVYGNHGPLV